MFFLQVESLFLYKKSMSCILKCVFKKSDNELLPLVFQYVTVRVHLTCTRYYVSPLFFQYVTEYTFTRK